jgi:hypothetical protein
MAVIYPKITLKISRQSKYMVTFLPEIYISPDLYLSKIRIFFSCLHWFNAYAVILNEYRNVHM